VTGLADALLMLGETATTAREARQAAATIMRTVAHAAYRASIDVARERGSFPALDPDRFLLSPFVAACPSTCRCSSAATGFATATCSRWRPPAPSACWPATYRAASSPSSGRATKRVVQRLDGRPRRWKLTDYAVALFESRAGFDAGPPGAMVDASSMAPEAHLDMQAALQPYVDAAISKTVNLPAGYSFEGVLGLFERAYAAGLKGLTVFPPTAPWAKFCWPTAARACDGIACQ